MADDIQLLPFGLPKWIFPFGGEGIKKTWHPGQLSDDIMTSLTDEELQALKYGVPAIAGLLATWLLLHPEVVTGLADAAAKATDAVIPDSLVGV